MKIYRIATTFGQTGWIISRNVYSFNPSRTHEDFVLLNYDKFKITLEDIKTCKEFYAPATHIAILKSNAVRYCVGQKEISLESTMQGLKNNAELIIELQEQNPNSKTIYVDIVTADFTSSETFNDIHAFCEFLGL